LVVAYSGRQHRAFCFDGDLSNRTHSAGFVLQITQEDVKVKQENEKVRDGTRLELKYCERCGGLWLRPAGGCQIYCATCSRAMAELPPVARRPENIDASIDRRNVANEYNFHGELELDAIGGAA
jgi:hypothetical protein